MMLALDARLSTSFVSGLVAAVNPCGFVLLPTYLVYFLGMSGAPGGQRASLRRAFVVSGALSAGFLTVFLVLGAISRLLTRWLNENARYAALAIGVAMIAFGIAMLFGYRPAIATRLDRTGAGGPDRTVRAMYAYGVAYAVASVGCAIGPFTGTVLGTVSVDGFARGLIAIGLYALAMVIVVTGLTVTIALARTQLLTGLRRAMPAFQSLAAVTVVASGLYLTWFWYTDITKRYDDGVVERVGGWQAHVERFVHDNRAPIVVVFGALIVVCAGLALTASARSGARGRAPS